MPSPDTERTLPPIGDLLKQGSSDGHDQYQRGTHRGTYNVQPAPRTHHPFPEAQVLAPHSSRGRTDYHTSPQSQYSSESMVSSQSDRRGSYASPTSSTMTSARESPNLPPLPGHSGSHGAFPIEQGRDGALPSMYSNSNTPYHHGGTVSPPRPGQYGPPYDNRPPPQDYMGAYAPRPPYGPGAPPVPYNMNLEPPGGDFGEGSKGKRRRGNLPKPVTDILRTWFSEHLAHPYPTEDEKQALMHQTGLSLSQISNWFINARRRSLPQMHKQAQTESDLRDGAMHMSSN